MAINGINVSSIPSKRTIEKIKFLSQFSFSEYSGPLTLAFLYAKRVGVKVDMKQSLFWLDKLLTNPIVSVDGGAKLKIPLQDLEREYRERNAYRPLGYLQIHRIHYNF